jgi:hypothetical protein
MATTVPLNTFRTEPYYLTTATQTLYTAPNGYTSIILGAQVSNSTSSTYATFTFILNKNGQNYYLLNNFEVPPYDAADATTGKLVIEQNCYVTAQASVEGALTMVLSVLETSNV